MDRKAVDPAAFKRSKRVPGMWEVFSQDMHTLTGQVGGWLESFLNWVLSFSKRGAIRRAVFIVSISLTLWLVLAVLSHPLGRGTDSILEQIVQALFSANVLRRLLLLWLALWLGVQLSARYLDDIFELENLSTALRYLWSAAFLGNYPVLHIQDGTVAPQNQESPVLRIGGPGWVNVHLENAALFERIDGEPHILSPHHQRLVLLDGFERLRAVVDLRDQMIEMTVSGRTQDGVPITAQDIRLVYSIERGDSVDLTLDGPQKTYPFSEDALLNLVYRQGSNPLQDTMHSLIRSEMSHFISRHTLSEFLTNAQITDEPERFIPRDEITSMFYDYTCEFSKNAEEHGVRLDWIGVGTWMVPSQIILERHLEAWKLSADTRMRLSASTLERVSSDARMAELLRLVDEIPALFYNLAGQGLSPATILRRLALTYREKLRNARDLYENQGQPVPPELDRVIQHITLLTAYSIDNYEE